MRVQIDPGAKKSGGGDAELFFPFRARQNMEKLVVIST